jgi:hypothetical protein
MNKGADPDQVALDVRYLTHTISYSHVLQNESNKTQDISSEWQRRYLYSILKDF